MSRQLTPLILLACAATFACGGEKPAPTPAATAAAKAAPAAPAATIAAAPAGDEVGVAECDDFLKKYEACVTQHVPAASKATFQEGIVQWRRTWKSIAAQPSARASLVGVCQQALATTKTAMSTHGCTW
jgi:hypothetical protein